jgi:hypothetical protein
LSSNKLSVAGLFVVLLAALGACSPQSSVSSQTVMPRAGLSSGLGSQSANGQADPWRQFALGYQPQLIVSAVEAANNDVWFADYYGNLLGRTTTAGKTTTFSAGNFVESGGPPTTTAADPVDVEPGPSNSTYFLASRGYGVISTSGHVTLYPSICFGSNACPFPQNLMAPASANMAVASDGSAWFGGYEQNGSSVMIKQKGADQTLFPLPSGSDDSASPTSVAIGPDNNIWFTQRNEVGKIDAISKKITTYTVPKKYTAVDSFLSEIANGPDHSLWVGDCNTNYVLRVSTSGKVVGTLLPFADLGCVQGSHQIEAGPPDGSIYLSVASNGVWRLNTANNQIAGYNIVPPPQSGGGVKSSAVGADHNLWAYQFSYPKVNVFLTKYQIQSNPATLRAVKLKKQTVSISEVGYAGKFIANQFSHQGCANVVPQESSSAFSVTFMKGAPCFVSFSDELGSGTVYVEIK